MLLYINWYFSFMIFYWIILKYILFIRVIGMRLWIILMIWILEKSYWEEFMFMDLRNFLLFNRELLFFVLKVIVMWSLWYVFLKVLYCFFVIVLVVKWKNIKFCFMWVRCFLVEENFKLELYIIFMYIIDVYIKIVIIRVIF